MTGLWWKRRAARQDAVMPRLLDPEDTIAGLLLDDAFGPALVIDAHGVAMRANAALTQMLQGNAPLLLGGPAEMLFQPHMRAAAREEITTLLRGRGAGGRSFASALLGGEAGQEIRVTGLLVREAEQNIAGAVLRFTDITPQRQLEAQLAHSQKLQATGQLAGGIAHDFNNLLTGIIGSLELLAMRLSQGRIQDLDRYVTTARGTADRAAALTQRLLSFARRQKLDPRAIPANRQVAEMEELIRRTVGPSDRRLS